MSTKVIVVVASLIVASVSAAPQAMPDWQKAAGGTMAFETASVKRIRPGSPFSPPNFPLDPGDSYRPTGGRFSAHFSLITYVRFAYKLSLTQEQTQTLTAQLPKSLATDSFDIEARAPIANPTKDQMRLMMQSLLAERFELKVHFEQQQAAVLALRLIKLGKWGPSLKRHSEGPACDAPAVAGEAVFPPICDTYMLNANAEGSRIAGSRNTTMTVLASTLPTMERLGKPLVDETGIAERVDFTLRWRPEPTAPPTAGVPPESDGPGFLDALREQLGIKLESTRGTLNVLVIDHAQEPSEN